MDRNRLLITGLGVAVFFTAVIAAGLVWFYPKQTAPQPSDSLSRVEFDPFAYVEDQEDDIRLEDDRPRDGLAEDEDRDETVPDSDEPASELDGPATELTEDGITIVFGARDSQRRITAPQVRPDDRQDPVSEQPSASDPQTEGTAAQDEPETVTDEPSVARSTTSGEREPAGPQAQAAAGSTTGAASAHAAKPEGRDPEEFWVQVFSGSSRTNAEEARKRFIEETTLFPLITTIDHEGRIFYRLRLGPYGDRREAEKMIGFLEQDSSFTASYISVVYN
ncbi:MAG: SPOR domain-containing protein [Spirochaeta sp.]